MAPARRGIKARQACRAGQAFKACLAALLLALASAAPVRAAAFEVRRGINLDAWVTWPAESAWNDPTALFPFPEWRRSLGEPEFARLKAAGFDFVRIPVDPAPFLSPVAASSRERLYAEVLAAARAANAGGLKAIVDLHLMPAGPGRKPGMGPVMEEPARFDAYVGIVGRMAETLRGEDPARVALEPMNEPILDCDADGTALWPERLKRLFAAARKGAPKLTLVMTGACYSGAEALAKVDPAGFEDDNLIWTFHSYNPFVLTHQGATWAGDFIPYVSGLPFPPYSIPQRELEKRLEAIRARIGAEAPWSRRTALLALLDQLVGEVGTPEKLDRVMNEPFETVAKWAAANGVAPKDVLLGEFGMIRQEYGSDAVMPAADRAAYVTSMATAAEKHGFAWSVWSYGGAFGIVDAFDGRPAEPDVLDAIRALPPYSGFTLRLEGD